jgi:hypothetical protein
MPTMPWRTAQSIESTTTYVVTITRLPLRSYLRIPAIMFATVRIMRELKTSKGLIGYALKADLVHKTFWTASAWTDDAALAGFVRSDTHRTAMMALQPHMGDARIATVTMPGSALPPTWPDIARRLAAASSSRSA